MVLPLSGEDRGFRRGLRLVGQLAQTAFDHPWPLPSLRSGQALIQEGNHENHFHALRVSQSGMNDRSLREFTQASPESH